MHIEIKSAHLTDELARLVPVAGKQSPVLSYARIEANGSLRMTTTNLKERMDCFVQGATVRQPGLVCLPVKRLHDLAELFNPQEIVSIKEQSNGRVEIKQGKTKYNLTTVSPGAFPSVSEDEFSDEVYTFPEASALRKMIRLVSGFIGEDDTNYAYSGAQIEFDGKRLILVSSNNQSLAFAERNFANTDDTHDKPLKVLIPQKALQQLLKLLSSVADSAPVEARVAYTAALKPSKVRFSVGTRRLTANLTTGAFPAYEQILKLDHKFRVEANTGDFSAGLKRLRQVLDERTSVARFEFGRQALRFSSVAKDVGDGFEEIPVVHTGDEKPSEIVTAGVNVEFFLDFLSAAREISPKQDAKISLCYSNSSAPMELGIPGGSETFRYIYSPMRLPEDNQ